MTILKQISSADNTQIKFIRALLTQHKIREQTQKYVLSGVHLVDTAIRLNRLPEHIFICESALNSVEVQNCINRLPVKCCTVVQGRAEEKLTTAVSGQIFAIMSYPKSVAIPSNQYCILLDGVRDPGNLGTILRSTVAVGIQHVGLSDDCADVFSPKVLRSGMGAHFALNIIPSLDLEYFLQHYQGQICITSLHSPQPKSLYQWDLTQETAWVFGNEGSGVRNTLLQLVNKTVYIPMHNHTESLNVAMAVTACLFEQQRQSLLD